MIGGGQGTVRPGEVPLAHGGVLFLDQAPEFAQDVLSALRQPMTDGEVAVSRHGKITRFPARFILIAGMTPCPCGSLATCRCTPLEVRRYSARAETELGSRLAISLSVSPPDQVPAIPGDLQIWAARVADARRRAARRFRGTPWKVNAEIPGSELARSWRPGTAAFAEVSRAVDLGQISNRSAIEVARLSWTLADLAGQSRPTAADCAQALAFHLGAAT
jgi:magnesium chelatase family protein